MLTRFGRHLSSCPTGNLAEYSSAPPFTWVYLPRHTIPHVLHRQCSASRCALTWAITTAGLLTHLPCPLVASQGSSPIPPFALHLGSSWNPASARHDCANLQLAPVCALPDRHRGVTCCMGQEQIKNGLAFSAPQQRLREGRLLP